MLTFGGREYLKSEEKSSGVSASATIKKVSIDGGFQTGRMTSSEVDAPDRGRP